jgi:putative oxidoreductase
MQDAAALIEMAGRIMIAFLFLFQGASAAAFRFGFHVERLRARRVPAPKFALVCGFAMMFIGGLMVLLDVFAAIGAGLLIAFTILATLLYQNFWSIEDPARRREKRSAFIYNVAIVGGLLLVVA